MAVGFRAPLSRAGQVIFGALACSHLLGCGGSPEQTTDSETSVTGGWASQGSVETTSGSGALMTALAGGTAGGTGSGDLVQSGGGGAGGGGTGSGGTAGGLGSTAGSGGGSFGSGGTLTATGGEQTIGGTAQGGSTNGTGASASGAASSAGTSGGTSGAGAGATSSGGITLGIGGTATELGGSGNEGGAGATSGGTAETGGAAGNEGTGATGGVAVDSGGTAGAGGVPGSTRLCATAAEGEAVRLTCPEGEVINAVSFASYGNPTGECGSFAAGTCDAESSEDQVTAFCAGRTACSVAASNGTFGDPCSGVVKDLAVEVSCVEGEPIEESGGPYKGVANSPADQIAALGATWCYNWMTSPQTTDCDDPYFVPMIWGPGDVAGAIQALGDAGYTTVLGFNEPNKSDQANMSVDDAIGLWPDMTSNPNIRVGSPAVSDDGRAWLEQFMDRVQAEGLRVDFIAMHWYGWNAGSCEASQLEGAVNWASQWSLPVWITEYGCMGSSNSDEQTVLDFFNDSIVMLESHPLVERYAWYPWNTYNHLYDEGGVPGMTALGQAFAAAPQYR